MVGKKSKLTILAEITTITVPVVGFLCWLYRTTNVSRAGTLWMGKVTWLIVALAFSFTANVLFSIASRRQAKSVPIKVAHGFHAGKIDGGEAALFWHYSAYSANLAKTLESMWQHWYEAGEVLSRPLDRDLPIKDVMGKHSRELDVFKIIYGEYLHWLNWEIPEFSSLLPPIGSHVEYLTLLSDLKTHAEMLDEAAKQVCESQHVEKGKTDEAKAIA